MRRLMKKVSFIVLLLSLFAVPFSNQAAADVSPESWPLDVYLYTDKSSYVTSEVVTWKVSISGGATTGPNFDVKFSDSRGNVVWAYDLKNYTSSFNLDYPKSGTITATVTVYGVGGPVSDSHTITIKTNQ
jgi:hypothetical protein